MIDRLSPRVRARIRKVAAILAIVVAPPGGYFAYRMATGNFDVVEPGRVYRASQMSASQLSETIRAQGIRTVLNLRGRNLTEAWYTEELDATLKAGATHIDVPMASDQWLGRSQLRTLVETLDTCDYPVLLHCQFGAERTGLVSAYNLLMRPGVTLEQARAQFSLRYLFLPIRDGATMVAQFDSYVAWLKRQGMAHSPERFRHWMAVDYRPGSPSREFWPYDPYPLRVVVWPEGAGPGTKTARSEADSNLR